MSWWGRGRWWCLRRGGGRAAAALRAVAAAALLVALGSARLGAVEQRRRDTLPHRPATIAHMLADFTYHTYLYPHIGSWSVVSESGNYTWWRYTVEYSCGARCRGEATLAAHERTHGPGPDHRAAHGPPASHRLLLAHTVCVALPVLHWPLFCDSWSTDTEVMAGRAGGALVTEHARARCTLAGALAGTCARALLSARDLHARRLRDLLLQRDQDHGHARPARSPPTRKVK